MQIANNILIFVFWYVPEMETLYVFKNYEPGDPNCRIYVKNLSKQVQEKVTGSGAECFGSLVMVTNFSCYIFISIPGFEIYFWKIH